MRTTGQTLSKRSLPPHGLSQATFASTGSEASRTPNLYVLVEAFENGAAGQAHVNSVHFKAAMAELPKWLSDVPEISVNVEIPGQGWSRMAEMHLETDEGDS